jgi:iron complex transport system ATP-binding protein
MIAATGIELGYGRRAVLRGVDLSLDAGELACVVAPNGAGKTTLLKVLAGIRRPSAGRVLLRSPLPPSYLAQGEPLPRSFTVREIVALGRLPHTGAFAARSARDDAAIELAMDRTGVRPAATTRASATRCCSPPESSLARALAQEADVLLLDEPTTYLDPRHQAALLPILAAEAARGAAALVVVHDLAVAASFPRVVLMAGGRIVADGPSAATLAPDRLEEVFGVPFETRQVTLPCGRREVLRCARVG